MHRLERRVKLVSWLFLAVGLIGSHSAQASEVLLRTESARYVGLTEAWTCGLGSHDHSNEGLLGAQLSGHCFSLTGEEDLLDVSISDDLAPMVGGFIWFFGADNPSGGLTGGPNLVPVGSRIPFCGSIADVAVPPEARKLFVTAEQHSQLWHCGYEAGVATKGTITTSFFKVVSD